MSSSDSSFVRSDAIYRWPMSLRHFARDAEPVRVAEHLAAFGCAIIDDLADDATLDRFAVEVAPYVDASAVGRDEYDGRHTRRTGALIARCPSVRRLVVDPTVLAVVRSLLAEATTVQLHLTQLISIAPGETRQKLHRDQMAFDLFPFPTDYHVQCNTIWALTDFTDDNGATHLVPGSSAVDDATAATMAEAQATMRRGSCLFYDGKIVHGGGANRSSEVRQGINLTYAVGWVRQEENQYLAVPPEIARTLDDDLLRLIGYQQGAFALGYVGDQTDPLAALRGTEEKVKIVGEMAELQPDLRRFADDATARRR